MSVGRRRLVQELRRMARSPNGHGLLVALFSRIDNERVQSYGMTGNGSARLVAFHDAVVDADDSLEAIRDALYDNDVAAAHQLIDLARESLEDRIKELKGLL